MKLEIDTIIASINTVVSGALNMARSCPDIVDGTAEHHERILELSPGEARRLREADSRMADALERLSEAASSAAADVRGILSRTSDN